MASYFRFKFRYTNIELRRVNYAYENNNDQTIKYCLMEDGADVKLFRQSQDDEPDYPVKFKFSGLDIEFEQPTDNYGQELLRKYQDKELLTT